MGRTTPSNSALQPAHLAASQLLTAHLGTIQAVAVLAYCVRAALAALTITAIRAASEPRTIGLTRFVAGPGNDCALEVDAFDAGTRGCRDQLFCTVVVSFTVERSQAKVEIQSGKCGVYLLALEALRASLNTLRQVDPLGHRVLVSPARFGAGKSAELAVWTSRAETGVAILSFLAGTTRHPRHKAFPLVLALAAHTEHGPGAQAAPFVTVLAARPGGTDRGCVAGAVTPTRVGVLISEAVAVVVLPIADFLYLFAGRGLAFAPAEAHAHPGAGA